jgi:hypothetical protein
MAGRTSKKKNDGHVLPDSDEQFAFIAGCTAGAAPYGVTREEHEETEGRSGIPQSENLPAQGSPVSLNDLAREMQVIFDTMTVYFKRSTGEFVAITDEYVRAAEEESFDDRPEWEQEAIRMTAEILAREDDGDYVPLPSKYDIHEYSIMERFCYTVKNTKTANDLFRSISGKGAFRRFKDAIRRHSIEEAWYRFKDEAYKEIAREWCRENIIAWCE